MRRWLMVICLVAGAVWLGAPALGADDPHAATGRVLISVGGDATLPAGDHADAVVVIRGNALIEGDAETVVVVEGTVTLTGAEVTTLTIINGQAIIGPGSAVERDVLELNSVVTTDPSATVGGDVRPLAVDLAGVGLALGVLGLLAWIGFALLTLIAGLVLAAFGSSQVRRVEWVISHEPLRTLLVGLALLVLTPVAAGLLVASIVGLPLGLAVLLVVWPALAFLGFILGSTWIGEWILRTTGRPAPERRPYLGVTLGLVVAMVLSLVPLVGALIAVFGMGGMGIAAWRTLTVRDRPAMPQPSLAPQAG